MRATEFTLEARQLLEMSEGKAKNILKIFAQFCKEHLHLDSLPQIIVRQNQQYSVDQKSFGQYGGKINVALANRHIMDVCRTLAHELVHYRQDINKGLTAKSGKTGSPEENEANNQAAVIMRLWGEKHPNLFGTVAVDEDQGSILKWLRPGELRGSYTDNQLSSLGFTKTKNEKWFIPQIRWDALVTKKLIG